MIVFKPLARSPDRVDQFPFAHLRAALDVLFLRQFIELLPIPILERVPRLAATPAPLRRLLAELAPGALGQMGDRPLPARRLLRLLHVLLRRRDLPLGCHSRLLQVRSLPLPDLLALA